MKQVKFKCNKFLMTNKKQRNETMRDKTDSVCIENLNTINYFKRVGVKLDD